MCQGSGLSAEVWWEAVPKIPGAEAYIADGCVPGGTNRNWASYGHLVAPLDEARRKLLADPQTSGGLLVAVDPAPQHEFEEIAKMLNWPAPVRPIGKLREGLSPIDVI